MTSTGESSALEWIRAHHDGDELAAGKLWARYAKRVERLAANWLRRARPATFDEQDVAISTFDALFSAIEDGRFSNVGSSDEFWQVLAVIALRKAKDRTREERAVKRRGTDGTQTLSLDDTSLHIDAPGEDVTPDVAALMADELQHLLEAVDDDELRQLIVLKLDGHTNEEIAGALGYSRSSIQRMLRTVRALWMEPAS